jgi:type VI secretion system protein ImpH
MSLPLFLDLLPRGNGYQPLCELIRFYCGPDLEFGFRLCLLAAEIPASRLGAARLGWTSWVRTRPFEHNDSQVHLSSRRPADPFAKLSMQSLPGA